MVDGAEPVDGDAVRLHDRDPDVDQALRVRERRRRFQRAVDEEGAEGAEVERARLAELALAVGERHADSFGRVRGTLSPGRRTD